MLSDPTTWFQAVLELITTGMTAPWTIAIALAALTLLLEDAAIAAGILLAGEGVIGWPLALAAVAGGIAAGDLLLYVAGLAARRIACVRHRLADTPHARRARRLLDRNLVSAVLVARVVPGLRLAVYTASGLFALPFVPFALMVLAAVAAWTGVLFWLGSAAGIVLARHWSVPPWQAAIALFALLSFLPILARRLAAVARRLRR